MRARQKLRKIVAGIDDYAVGAAAAGDGSLKWPIFRLAASMGAAAAPASCYLCMP